MRIILLLLISFSVNAQVYQFNDYLFTFPNTAKIEPASYNGVKFQSVIGNDTLLRIYSNGMFIYKASLMNNDITDSSSNNNKSICTINIPNSVGSNTVIHIDDNALIVPNKYRIEYSNFWQPPFKIYRKSDNALFATVYDSGLIEWEVTPQRNWVSRFGNTRLKRITLP